MTAEAELEGVLQLAQEARRAHDSPQWKTDTAAAIERHGDACDALWSELYRLLDTRSGAVQQLKPAPDERKMLRKAVIAQLKAELPAMIAGVLDEMPHEAS